MVKKRITLIGLILVSLLFSGACREKVPTGFAGSGTLEATEVTVSALIGAQILNMKKEEGERVGSKELLATLDVEKLILKREEILATYEELDAQKETVEAEITQAVDHQANVERQYKRLKALYKKGSTTQQQFDDVSTQRRLARSQVTAAKAQGGLLDARRHRLDASLSVLDRQIADGKIFSPLNGVVVEKYVEPGEVVTLGGAVYKIADLEKFWLKIYLAGTDIGEAALGKEVLVRVDAYEKPLKAKVTWVSTEAEFTPKSVQTKKTRAELVYAVKVTLEESPEQLKIGMPAEVYF